MQSLGCLGMALLQDDAGALQHDVHLLMIFMAIIAIAVVIGFLLLAIGGIMVLGFARKAHAIMERIEGKASPLIDRSHALVEELSPKIRTITTNVEQISYTVRGKVDEFGATATCCGSAAGHIGRRLGGPKNPTTATTATAASGTKRRRPTRREASARSCSATTVAVTSEKASPGRP